MKPFVKSNKSDTIDAEAIAEAVVRPTMRFVQIRSPQQIDVQALHRIRSRLVSSRTRLVNQTRAMCQEYGVVMPQGIKVFMRDIPSVIEDLENDLTQSMRRILADLVQELHGLNERLSFVTREIEAIASTDETARRLATITRHWPLGCHGTDCRSWRRKTV